MNKRLKILFISLWYPNRDCVLDGLFVRKHAEAVSLFADVNVLYLHNDENIIDFETECNETENLTELKIYYPGNNKNLWNRIKKQINYLRAYRKGFREIKKKYGLPDLVQANVFTRTAFIAYLIKLRYKIPYTVIEHWTRYYRPMPKSPIHKYLSKLTAKKSSAIFPVTYKLQASMQLYGMKNNNYVIINNVVNDAFFQNKTNIPKSTKKRILCVTSFYDAHKNVSGILHVVSELSKLRQDFEYYLVGNGLDFEKIKILSKELDLYNKFVFFTDILEGQALIDMYYQSHFTTLFSDYENIPVVISESLACGLPVVTTDVGGIAEHINDSNGILFKAGDNQGYLESLNYMLDHYQNYDPVALKKEAFEKYSYLSVGKKLNDIYIEILKGKSPVHD